MLTESHDDMTDLESKLIRNIPSTKGKYILSMIRNFTDPKNEMITNVEQSAPNTKKKDHILNNHNEL